MFFRKTNTYRQRKIISYPSVTITLYITNLFKEFTKRNPTIIIDFKERRSTIARNHLHDYHTEDYNNSKDAKSIKPYPEVCEILVLAYMSSSDSDLPPTLAPFKNTPG